MNVREKGDKVKDAKNSDERAKNDFFLCRRGCLVRQFVRCDSHPIYDHRRTFPPTLLSTVPCDTKNKNWIRNFLHGSRARRFNDRGKISPVTARTCVRHVFLPWHVHEEDQLSEWRRDAATLGTAYYLSGGAEEQELLLEFSRGLGASRSELSVGDFLHATSYTLHFVNGENPSK